MSNLCVITAAYPDLNDDCLLDQSCDFPVGTFGFDKPWPGFVKAKIFDVQEFLKTISSCTHALYTDCFDSFLLADTDEIMRNFRAMNSPVVISAEKNCFPLTDLDWHFKHSSDKPDTFRSEWIYPNAGGWMGEIPALIATLEKLREYVGSALPDDDQAYWCQGLATGTVRAKIDTGCRIFQTMANSDQDVRVIEGRLYNLTTESCPCVVHFNGRTPGMEEMWAQINRG